MEEGIKTFSAFLMLLLSLLTCKALIRALKLSLELGVYSRVGIEGSEPWTRNNEMYIKPIENMKNIL